MNKFLVDGQIDNGDIDSTTSQNPTEQHNNMSMDCSNSYMESSHPKNNFDMDQAKDIVMQKMNAKYQTVDSEIISKSSTDVPGCSDSLIFESRTDDSDKLNAEDSSHKSSVAGPDLSKPLRKKAKLLRMERKAQKLSLANKLRDDIPKKQPKNVQKSLDTLLNEVPGNSRHKLEV